MVPIDAMPQGTVGRPEVSGNFFRSSPAHVSVCLTMFLTFHNYTDGNIGTNPTHQTVLFQGIPFEATCQIASTAGMILGQAATLEGFRSFS